MEKKWELKYFFNFDFCCNYFYLIDVFHQILQTYFDHLLLNFIKKSRQSNYKKNQKFQLKNSLLQL